MNQFIKEYASLAQLNRASRYGREGWEFESLRELHRECLLETTNSNQRSLFDSRPVLPSWCKGSTRVCGTRSTGSLPVDGTIKPV